MSVSAELLCSFELLKPLDSAALKNHIKKGRNKRNSILSSPVSSLTFFFLFRCLFSPRSSNALLYNNAESLIILFIFFFLLLISVITVYFTNGMTACNCISSKLLKRALFFIFPRTQNHMLPSKLIQISTMAKKPAQSPIYLLSCAILSFATMKCRHEC